MAVSAHPDDETLGCGGTLLRHRELGDETHWLIATSRHAPRWSAEEISLRGKQIAEVSRAYGFASVTQLSHPDAALEQVPFADVVEGVDQALSTVRPEIVYVVHGGDVHTDHALTHRAVMSALKAFRMPAYGTRRVLAYETLSSTDAAVQDGRTAFLPTVFADITGHLDAKCEVMRSYAPEIQDGWAPRTVSAIAALARVRGAAVGVEHAEAFVLLRELV